MPLVKLTALDAEDLEVISAHMQDAVIRSEDIKFLRRSCKFALIANRFVWEHEGQPERRRAGLHFDRVRVVKSRRIKLGEVGLIFSLLAIRFEPDDVPSGTVVLEFSGGGAIHLGVECIEARLEDLGPAWDTPHVPSHER
jgi:Protein of unknown function (DUF2948)